MSADNKRKAISIVLSHAEWDNFQSLAEFVIFQKRDIKNIMEIGYAQFDEEVGLLVNSKKGTISNKNSKGERKLKVRSFNHFCKELELFFAADNRSEKYAIKYELFIKWKDGIRKRLGWESSNDDELTSNEESADDKNERQGGQVDIPIPNIHETEFLNAIETIRNYYKINPYLPDEIRSFKLLDMLVRNRSSMMAELVKRWGNSSYFFEDENCWEIYELQNDKIIVRSFHYTGLNGIFWTDDIIPGFECSVAFGKKDQIKFPVENYEMDTAYFDMSQQTVRITDELTANIVGKKTTELFNFSFRRDFSGAYVGHKFCLDASKNHQPEMTSTPAVLYGQRKEYKTNEDQHHYFYDELEIQDERIPNFIRAILINWKEMKVDPQPFNDLPFTILDALGGYNALSYLSKIM